MTRHWKSRGPQAGRVQRARAYAAHCTRLRRLPTRLEQEVPLEAPRPAVPIVLVEHERLRVADRELECRVHRDPVGDEEVVARIDRDVMHYAKPVGEVILVAPPVGRRAADRALPAITQ